VQVRPGVPALRSHFVLVLVLVLVLGHPQRDALGRNGPVRFLRAISEDPDVAGSFERAPLASPSTSTSTSTSTKSDGAELPDSDSGLLYFRGGIPIAASAAAISSAA
jgi:hypothetical protein